jgi:ATP-dependent protease HslVU (ClpYQ) peptidase subunit
MTCFWVAAGAENTLKSSVIKVVAKKCRRLFKEKKLKFFWDTLTNESVALELLWKNYERESNNKYSDAEVILNELDNFGLFRG